LDTICGLFVAIGIAYCGDSRVKVEGSCGGEAFSKDFLLIADLYRPFFLELEIILKALLVLYEEFAYNCVQRGGRKTGQFAEEPSLKRRKVG
jgi:hypothetical protein